MLLAAILFPVLGSAKAKARETTCISQLRQIGKAFHMYSDDYDNRPPHLHDLWPSYVSDKRLFVCPSDRWIHRGGWAWSAWGRDITPPEMWPIPISYGYFFSPDLLDPYWRLAQEVPGRPGYVVCVLHGEPQLTLNPKEAPHFQGRTLRLCFDGSVIGREIRYRRGIFHAWQLMTDQEYAPGQPRPPS